MPRVSAMPCVLAACALALGAIALPAAGAERSAKSDEIKPAVLYHNYCSVCHGDRGDGNSRAKGSLVPPPKDFTQASYLNREWIMKVTADGKPGTAMVGWKTQLKDKEIAALADYILATFVNKTQSPPTPTDLQGISGTHAHGGKSAPDASDAPAPAVQVDMSLPLPNKLKPDVAWGEKFYRENCATCHGKDGDGQGPRAYFINPKPENFRSEEARRVLNRPALFAAIQWGKNGTDMPAWKHVLSDQEMANVAEYVFRSFIQSGTTKTSAKPK